MAKNIPIHKLQERSDLGLEVSHTSDTGVRSMIEGLQIHRDDSYIFILTEKEEGEGGGSAIIDFTEIALSAQHIYYIKPGQIHHNITTNGGGALFISAAANRVPPGCREIFEANLVVQQPFKLSDEEFAQFRSIAHLLYIQFHKDQESPFYSQLLHTVLQSFLYLFAQAYVSSDHDFTPTSRPFQITRQFKQLMSEKIKQEKSPSFYAGHINISEVYLNEVIKNVTGFNVTHWLMNEVMLEAKRLLIYSQLNIKEISYELGYEDHAYFSRLFKKQTTCTPSEFRNKYLK